VVVAELAQRQHFHKLFERAEATGQHQKGVGPREHDGLAFLKRLRDDERVGQFVGDALALLERFGDDAHDASAVPVDATGQRAHESHIATAVDQLVAGLCQPRAHLFGQLSVVLIHPLAGGAVDADAAGHGSGFEEGG